MESREYLTERVRTLRGYLLRLSVANRRLEDRNRELKETLDALRLPYVKRTWDDRHTYCRECGTRQWQAKRGGFHVAGCPAAGPDSDIVPSCRKTAQRDDGTA